MKIININDKNYPEKLKKIQNPPDKLYVLGDEKILNSPSISIIGSRNCTEYGIRMTRKFVKELSNNGITIVSGMAKGIDSYAHLAAIENAGKTIAVLGSGFKHIYPDKSVFDQIITNGGTVITEYEENVEVFSQGFRERNRIVAGLSIGTLVIEAKEHSGTGITAKYAKNYNRKLFCIPHIIGDESGVGTNRLIKQGANLVTEVADILKYFDKKNIIQSEKKELQVEIPEEYKNIYKEIKMEAINADEIRKKVNQPISEVNTILTMLELEGFIESLPGNYFKRKEF